MKPTVFAVSLMLLSYLVAPAAADEDYLDSKFDGVWAGYLELDGVEFPLLLNFNAQKAASIGYLFFLTLAEDEATFNLKPFPLSGIKVRPNKVKFNFSILYKFDNVIDLQAKKYNLSLKYDAKNGTLKGSFSFRDPESGAKHKGSVLLYLMDEAKTVQGLWHGELPDEFGLDDELPLYMLLTQNSPVGGSLLLMPKQTPLKNGQFADNRLTGSLQVDTEAGFNTEIDIDLEYKSRILQGKFGYRVRKRFIGIDVKLWPAGTKAQRPHINTAGPKKIVGGEELTIAVKGKGFYPGAVIHLDNPALTVSWIEFVGSGKVRAIIKAVKNADVGTKSGVLLINPDNSRAAKAAIITIIGK